MTGSDNVFAIGIFLGLMVLLALGLYCEYLNRQRRDAEIKLKQETERRARLLSDMSSVRTVPATEEFASLDLLISKMKQKAAGRVLTAYSSVFGPLTLLSKQPLSDDVKRALKAQIQKLHLPTPQKRPEALPPEEVAPGASTPEEFAKNTHKEEGPQKKTVTEIVAEMPLRATVVVTGTEEKYTNAYTVFVEKGQVPLMAVCLDVYGQYDKKDMRDHVVMKLSNEKEIEVYLRDKFTRPGRMIEVHKIVSVDPQSDL